MSFADPELGVVVCRHVANGQRAVGFSSRYQDGEWAFTCGEADHTSDADYVLIHVHHLLEADPSLDEVASLAPGWSAERKSVGADWLRFPDPDAEVDTGE
jgi:hypothetical protein